MYQGLRFKEWQTNIEDDIVIQNGQSINMTAVYENCIIRYLIDPIFVEKFMIWWWDESDLETIICQVAEKGEEVLIYVTDGIVTAVVEKAEEGLGL